MKKIYWYIFLTFITLPLTIIAQKDYSINIDSSILKNKIFPLHGKWRFYWKNFLHDINDTTGKNFIYAKVPKSWNNYKINGKKLPIKGYGTYYTKIILPKDTIYAFNIKLIFSAYKLWINGELISQKGILGTSKDEEVPAINEKTILYNAQSDTLNVFIQVSNFHYYTSGIAKEIYIGTPKNIFRKNTINLGADLFVLGVFLLFSIFFIVQFANTRKLSQLFLVLYIIAQSIIDLFSNDLLLFQIFPSLNFIIAIKIFYFTQLFKLIAFIAFIKYFAKDELNEFYKITFNLSYLILLLYTGIILYLSPEKFMWIDISINIIKAFYSIIMLIYLYTLYSQKNIKKALWIFIGLSAIFLTGAFDFLNYYKYIQSLPNLINYGILTFVIIYSIIVSKESAETFDVVQNLSDKITFLNILKNKLLSIPSYKLNEIFKEFINTLKIERGLLFFVINETLILQTEIQGDKIIDHKKPIEELSNDYFDIELLLRSFLTKQPLKYDFQEGFYISKYTKNKKIQSIRIMPLKKNKEIIAQMYLENHKEKITDTQDEIITITTNEFVNIIDTASTYWELQNMNEKLEERIKQETYFIEQQKKEIANKNQELKEKVEQIKEHNKTLMDLNKKLELQKKILEEQNEEIFQQKEEIEQQKNELTLKNKILTSNIQYAHKIQQIVIKQTKNIPFKESFLINLPKNIISGDFYYSSWFKDIFVFAVADCTGHGVPGALMSMLSASGLTDILNKYFFIQNKIPKPGQVLNDLRNLIITTFNEEQDIKDGLDIALCFYFPNNKKILFAGAYNPLYIIRNGEIIILKGDRMPVGYYFQEAIRNFSTQEIILQENDMLYLFSDGYADQFGGQEKTKFYIRNFKKLLLEIHNLPLTEQKNLLIKKFQEWKNGEPQTDDITILGYKI